MIGLCLKYESANFGSKLQARATLQLMEDLGLECKVIHYGKKDVWFKIKSLLKLIDPTFRQDKLEHISRDRAYKQHPEIASILATKKKVSKAYDAQYFDKYEIYGAKYCDIQKIASQCQAVVTCSDQLWSPASWKTNFYNLMFVPDSVRKVSFASSFGVSVIPWYQKSDTKAFLNRIEYVSCRENRGAEIVKELTGKDVPVLMDPVFAYDKDEWSNMVIEEIVYKEPYLLCYLLGANEAHRKVVKKFAQEKGLKIVFFKYLDQYVAYDATFGDITPFDADANKFLNILRGAAYVITDSFHGCAFSIIMQKNFVVFNRYASNSTSSKNSRIDTVCSNLGLNARRVDVTSDLNAVMSAPIDWISVRQKQQVYKERLKSYLKEALTF